MRAQTLATTIKVFHANNLTSPANKKRALLIEGEPGLGKSSVPQQVARELGIGCILFNVPLRLQEDYGMPVINADRTAVDFLVSDKTFPFEGSDHFPDEGVLTADELSGANTPEQKVWAGIIQDRMLHGRQIKPGWTIIATGNRTKDRAGANRILSMLANRLTRVTFEPDLNDWCNWAMSDGVHPMLISFLRFKPNLLSMFDPNQDCCPTPRAWAEGVSPFIDNVPDEIRLEVHQGAVGEGAAAEFSAFMKICLKMPNPDAILMTPDTAEVPTEPSILYAVSGAIAARASKGNFERVMTYAKRMPPEFMVLVVRDSMAHDRTVVNTKAFIDWTMKEGANVLM